MRPEQLTGALEPLRDEKFFRQVFIDDGAPTWPGEIDLAPDAMYAEVAGSQKTNEFVAVSEALSADELPNSRPSGRDE